MAELKTQPNRAGVKKFLRSIDNPTRRRDALKMLDIMGETTGQKPQMWGSAIVGFGSYHYKYASGREGDWMMTGFSPRKAALTVYIMAGFPRHDALMKKLGKHKTGKSCLYINKLEDVDEKILRELIKASWTYMLKTYH